MLFINGQEAKLSLDDLIAKGRELIASGYPQVAKFANQEMTEAATAVHWYGEQHRAWVKDARRMASAGARIGQD